MGKFNYELAALILVEALYTNDEKAAKKFGVSSRSVRNYRKRMETDEELSALFHDKRIRADKNWGKEIPKAIQAGVNYLIKVSDNLDPEDTTPEMIHAVTGSIKLLAEIRLTKDVIDAKYTRQNKPTNQEN